MPALPRQSRIEDYAMIGDCRTAALVSRNGSIDWLCLPRFDSAACFAALLGNKTHGNWRISPKAKASVSRVYDDGSLILETIFTTAGGRVSVLDFMPVNQVHSSVIRVATGLSGRVAMAMDLAIRFDYGMTMPWMSRAGKNVYTAVAGPDMLTLHTAAPVQGKGMRTAAEFTLSAGQTMTFTLTNSRSYDPVPPALNIGKLRSATARFWKTWSGKCKDVGPYTPLVSRSLITLKGLIYQPTGGIVAAPTTSLPEEIGGGRNWDYRYCWVRDATFTLLAFMNAGYMDEAVAWRNWLQRAVAGSPAQLQIMYGIAGERRLPESEIPWLPGYKNSVPVRIGNAAADQLQLDVYGELMDAMAQGANGGMAPTEHSSASTALLLQRLEQIWREPDNGIWEIRGALRHFTHSKVMAWVAFHRVAEAPQFRSHRLHGHYRRIAADIHREICANGMDPTGKFFVQYYGGKQIDASLLLLSIVGFLPPDDPRIAATVNQIETRLMPNGLVLRYETSAKVDGLSGAEGAFLACSFWMVDNLVLLGRVDDARKLFKKLAGFVNDVGLLSEEYDAANKRMLGNFPQAFSHVAMINSAIGLHHAEMVQNEHQLAPSERRQMQKTVYRHVIKPSGKTR